MAGALVYANAGWHRYTGLTLDEANAKGWDSLVHPEDRPRLLEHWEKARQDGEPFLVEYRCLRRDGTYRWFRGLHAPVRDKSGMVSHWACQCSELDSPTREEQRRAEQALEASQRLSDRILRTAPQIVIIYEICSNRILYIGGMVEQTVGYSAEQIQALSAQLRENLHPDDQLLGIATPERWRGTRDGEVKEATFRFKGADGDYRWLASRSTVFSRGEDGEPTQVLTSIIDLTQQKEAEAALRKSEELFRGLADTMPQIVWCSRPQGGAFFVNKRYYDYAGIPPDTPGEQGWHTVVHPEDMPRARATYSHALETRTIWECELRLRDGQGNYRWHLSRSIPIFDENRELLHWLGTSTDIHDRVTYEEELERRVTERTAQLQEAVQELEGFTYSVSHDLRTPLRAIVAHARMLEEDYAKDLPEEAREHLHRQADAARHLGTLIDELLRLSRIGREELTPAPFDLSELVTGIVQDLEERFGEHSHVFHIQPNMQVTADSRLLRLAIANLLENAIKYSARGTAIAVGQEGGVTYVRDQGIGFDMKYEDKIWLPFERLVAAEAYSGTGIGLANVRRIIERHGGRVWVESEPGRGSTFYFTLGSIG